MQHTIKPLPPLPSLPSGSAGGIASLGVALNDAVDIARKKRQEFGVKFFGQNVPKGAGSASSLGDIVSILNRSAAPLSETVVKETLDLVKPKAPAETEKTRNLKTAAFMKVRPLLEKSKGDDGYVDPNVYLDLMSQYAEVVGDVDDFNKVFAPLLSPQERQRLFERAGTIKDDGEIANPFE